MAISSKQYGDLYEGSDVGGSREKGPFVKVFITGTPREGQTPGTMSAIYSQKWDEAGDEKYLIHNATEVKFIPMFIKKVREKYEKDPQTQRSNLTWFSFNPEKEENTPDGAKMVYLFAGVLLDKNMKPIPDKLEPERTAFIFFKCNGSKFGPAIDYVNSLNKQGENLEPLSDDPNFEKAIVLPRRFICNVKVKIGDVNSYGNRPYLHDFEVGSQLPDNTVEQLMDRCQKWWEPFKTQFDLSSVNSNFNSTGGRDAISSSEKENVTFDSVGEDSGSNSIENVADGIPEEELDLGI